MILKSVPRGLPCAIEAKGTFYKDLDSIDLDFDIWARLEDGQTSRLIAVKDNMCDWATIEQGGQLSCPPHHGEATISAEVALLSGWVMEVGCFGSMHESLCGNALLTGAGCIYYRSEAHVRESAAHGCWREDRAEGSGQS